jgi:glutathione peroxidase
MSRLLLLATTLALPLMSASAASLYDVPLRDIDEQPTTLAAYRGEVMLIVNVASKCGNTPQYAQLESLYQQHGEQGLVVLGFPCNQFKGQEPGSNEEIKAFCTAEYGVTFPLFDKIDVNGENRHPLYVQLAGADSPFPGDIEWNFAKFLVGRDGRILARFPARMKPDAPEIVAAINAALAAPAAP